MATRQEFKDISVMNPANSSYCAFGLAWIDQYSFECEEVRAQNDLEDWFWEPDVISVYSAAAFKVV